MIAQYQKRGGDALSHVKSEDTDVDPIILH